MDIDVEKEAKKKKKVKVQEATKLDDATIKEYEETLAKIDNYGGEELGQLIKKYNIKGPTSGAELEPPRAFNLMFQTTIGPSADRSAYDLTVHREATSQPLCVRETRAEPLKIEEYQIDIDKKKFGRKFKKDAKTVE